jgi:hypothetical protein
MHFIMQNVKDFSLAANDAVSLIEMEYNGLGYLTRSNQSNKGDSAKTVSYVRLIVSSLWD